MHSCPFIGAVTYLARRWFSFCDEINCKPCRKLLQPYDSSFSLSLFLSLSHIRSSICETVREKLTKILRERITTPIYLDAEHRRCYWCLSRSSCDIDFDGIQLQVVSFSFLLSFFLFLFLFSFTKSRRCAHSAHFSALRIYLERHFLCLSYLYTYLLR